MVRKVRSLSDNAGCTQHTAVSKQQMVKIFSQYCTAYAPHEISSNIACASLMYFHGTSTIPSCLS